MSDRDRSLVWYLTHPGAMLGAVATVLVSSVDLVEPLVVMLTTTVSTWFPLLSTLNSIAGIVPELPARLFQKLFLAGAVAYVVILVGQLISDLTNDK